jgi:uncharacterized protein YkwD
MPSQKFIFFILTGIFLLFNAVHCRAQESIKDETLDEINKVRVSGCLCGDEEMPPVEKLAWSDRLEKAALRHARDMFDHDHFSHTGTDGSDLGDRISGAGYEWSMVGENIAWGHTEVIDAVEGWISSPEHCKNMMSEVFSEMGAARKGQYWVLDLGAGK